jgi:hypothetical protein
MKVGDLVRKRWGRIEPHEQGAVAVCLGPQQAPGLLLTGPLVKIMYCGHRPQLYKSDEFEVISESR